MSLPLMNLLRPYLITLLLEILVAVLWGIRSKKDFLVVFLVNTITNPLLNLSLYLMSMYLPYSSYRGIIPIMELLIWVLEGLMFKTCMQSLKKPFLFSCCLNAVSYFLGGYLLKIL